MIMSSTASRTGRSVEQDLRVVDTSRVKTYRRGALVLSIAAVLVAAIVVLGAERPHGCEALARADLFDSVSDIDESNPHATIEAAVQGAFVEAGMPRVVGESDLDIAIRGDDNLVHVGSDGYWIMLATVPDGFVIDEPPRPCSVLED
jgi:hypothetical protein